MLALAVAIAVNLVAIAAALADIRITDDRGGDYRAYVARVAAARASGERVVIDGPCYSACTLHLSLPPAQICATARGEFGFHAARTELGLPAPAETDAIWNAYPARVRIWLGQRGGLWLDLKRAPARLFVRSC